MKKNLLRSFGNVEKINDEIKIKAVIKDRDEAKVNHKSDK